MLVKYKFSYRNLDIMQLATLKTMLVKYKFFYLGYKVRGAVFKNNAC